jgi:hypothetical protein
MKPETGLTPVARRNMIGVYFGGGERPRLHAGWRGANDAVFDTGAVTRGTIAGSREGRNIARPKQRPENTPAWFLSLDTGLVVLSLHPVRTLCGM